MLIALKEKCKENAKHLPSAPSSRQDGVRERAQQGERQLNKSRRRRVYHQFRKELHIIKAESFVYHHCESKIQPTADDIHLR